jgi:NCAIR mutase (PurE)-related protein
VCTSRSQKRIASVRHPSPSVLSITRRFAAPTKPALATQHSNQSPDDILSSFANLDHQRASRTGFPEAVFGQGKTPTQIHSILDSMANNVNDLMEASSIDDAVRLNAVSKAIIATRIDKELYDAVVEIGPLQNGVLEYHETARIISVRANSLLGEDSISNIPTHQPSVVVACAGTTDLPVAEEAAITLSLSGVPVTRIYDCGVAGLHRIISALPKLRDPTVGCVIVCAGMDGALPSVVGGLVDVPVVAIPTSVGYGMSLNGMSALLTMLNSCSPGVGVVNVDNGFGGAVWAMKVIRRK